MRAFSLIAILLGYSLMLSAEDGYRLWLRYDLIADQEKVLAYSKAVSSVMVSGDSPTMAAASRELSMALFGMIGKPVEKVTSVRKHGVIVMGTPSTNEIVAGSGIEKQLAEAGHEGYVIMNKTYRNRRIILIAGNSDIGILYGTFHFLRLIQTGRSIENLSIVSSPALKIRILNHWDNLNRTVERGYAGLSLWDWKSLPDTISTRYTDYARANASVGINGTVLTNVNANALVLTTDYIRKVASLASLFRPYGIRVYLTARFSAPVEIGKLKTADPLDQEVISWWKKKAEEIYSMIPDFGGFTVKANSEGQPGPQNYGRSHADGANMLADAVAPFGGVVMWRAFVYDNNVPVDRALQAYNEFMPLDGKFRDNVIIQVKNGPVDFQPREPFHPLFGAMKNTSVMPELQITQEYLGSSTHLVYLAPLFEECLKSDTRAKGKGSLVADAVTGRLYGRKLTAMAGVSNIGSVTNWTGHPFGQANWYAFGRLAWDPYSSSGEIADDWIRMTFTWEEETAGVIRDIMMSSRETAVSYMTPLGLHHIMYAGHHYGPGPWVDRGRQDWTSVYYHRADSAGIGFNRTTAGSNAVSQYFPEVKEVFNDPETCPENLLLWFHHLPWEFNLKSGNTLWHELCLKYDQGVKTVRRYIREWEKLGEEIDQERYDQVRVLLAKQERDAMIWKNGCILYFQTFSGRPLPAGVEKPDQKLEYYKNHKYTDIPGIR